MQLKIKDNMITHYDIEALIDNELEWKERIRVYKYVMSDIVAYKTYKRLLQQKKLIQKWYQSKKISKMHH